MDKLEYNRETSARQMQNTEPMAPEAIVRQIERELERTIGNNMETTEAHRIGRALDKCETAKARNTQSLLGQ